MNNNNRGLEEVVWDFTNAYLAPLVWLEPCLYWTIYKLPFEVFASWNHLLSEALSVTWESGQLPCWHCGKTQWFKSTDGGVGLRDCVIHLCHLLATWHSSYLMALHFIFIMYKRETVTKTHLRVLLWGLSELIWVNLRWMTNTLKE